MSHFGAVLVESAIVAAAMAGIMTLVHSVHMKQSPMMAMSHAGILIQVGVSAAILHVVFELIGWNGKFCLRLQGGGRM